MADEEDPTIETDGEGEEEGEASLGEDFRDIYNGFEETQKKWMGLAAKSTGDRAEILRLIAGDLIPLLSDFAALSGISFDTVEEAIEAGNEEEDGDAGPHLSDENVTMVYMALLSCQQTLKALVGKLPTETQPGVSQLVDTAEQALGVLRETYGAPLLEAADEIVKAATP